MTVSRHKGLQVALDDEHGWRSDRNVGRSGKRYILNDILCHAKHVGLILGNSLRI